MTQIPIRVWTGQRQGKKTMIACRSERRAAEILGIAIIKLREWKQIPHEPWMEVGTIYQWEPDKGWSEEE